MSISRAVCLALIILAGAAGGRAERPGEHATAASPPAPPDTPPITFHCRIDASCPEISIVSDPPATLGGGAAPVRGIPLEVE